MDNTKRPWWHWLALAIGVVCLTASLVDLLTNP